MIIRLNIKFLTEWQVTSGIGDGYYADNRLSRDKDGFPFIPGRALKGALREGATLLSKLDGREDLIKACTDIFGTGASDNTYNEPGIIFVSNAVLSSDIREILLSEEADVRKDAITDMISYRAETALDKNTKQAKTGSLRNLECGIAGIELEAEINVKATDKYTDNWLLSYLKAVTKAVKSIGADRARGLGRCEITIVDVDGNPIDASIKTTLPEKL